MAIVDDLIARGEQLAADRAGFERIWREVAAAVMPNGPDFDAAAMGPDALARPRTAERAARIYESTGVWAGDRLSAGLESLVTPQSEKWHGLGLDDPMAPEPADEEAEWLDRLRDYLFAVRYDARAGFVEANQQALRSLVNFGTGLIFLDEGHGPVPVHYRPMSLAECHLGVDHLGRVDTVYRRFALTARQALQKFGARLSPRLTAAAESERERDRRFSFLHVVQPRADKGARDATAAKAPFASFHVEVDERRLVGEAGFFEFPYVDYRWQPQPGEAYGEGPVMLALADIKTLNAMSKTALRAGQQAVDPPLAVADDGVTNRPNLNARAINYGAIDQNGRLRIQPIITAQRPDFAEAILDQRRAAVRESLYVNLFQALLQNPGMTATEALIRSNEKGQLLGPAGARIQNGLARLIEREIGILQRKGYFEADSGLAPPESLVGRPFGARFTSPLDRLRRANELLGVERTLEMAVAIGQVDPSVYDNLDGDEALRLAADITGAPRRILRREAERDQVRQAREQMAQAEAAAGLAQQFAGAAKDGIPALQALGDAGPAIAEAADALAQSQ
jgi:hypothetical protein